MQRHEHAGPAALRAMQSLATRTFPATGYHHIGDLTWNWRLALDRADQCPTAVWTQGDQTLAWGWLELPDTLMLQVDQEHTELAHEVLTWAEHTASGPLSIDVTETEPHLIRRWSSADTHGPTAARSWRALAAPSPTCRTSRTCRTATRSAPSATMPMWQAGRQHTAPPSDRPESPPNGTPA
ncbi:hypothetical protein [Streptomyces sp. NPDC056191]|uniref:hypothetical protein n=1 Tax=Streptomyces sp. NPDC056191 TaxID=3345742 RepID=UPI0035E3AB68